MSLDLSEFAAALDDNPFEETPVDLDTFLYDENYLNQPPLSQVQRDLVESMSQIFKKDDLCRLYGEQAGTEHYNKYTKQEVILQLGKGSGKDHTSTIGCAYLVYKLMCLKDPARYFGKPPGDSIDIINIAINAQQAKNVFFKNFKTKVDAGANSAITQFFFNVDSYFKFIEECEQLNISIPIVPGIMPIYNIKQLSRFAQTCGAEIPRWLKYKLESYGDDIESLREFGIDFISELCETLQQFGVESFHFYTLNECGIVSKVLKNISD